LRFTSTTMAKLLPLFAVGGRVVLVRVGAPALRNDVLSLAQKVIADLHRLAQQAAGIVAQVQYQPLQVAEFVDGFDYLLGGGLLKLGQVM